MNFLEIYKHLLPTAKAWNLTATKKLRSFFEGLSFAQVRSFFDLVWLDIFPATTRELDAWEDQFGLPNTNLTEQERRDRLDAAWKAFGCQDPRCIQDTLQANGFNVFLHEWWVPGTEPAVGIKQCVEPRNPFQFLREDNAPAIFIVECGEAVAECGEVDAEAGNTINPTGFPLVNKVSVTISEQIVLCGEAVAECGEELAECDERTSVSGFKKYTIPTDKNKWPYFLYIGGKTFPDNATVDPARRDEFEALCLKICPAQQWLGILVDYT